MKKVKKISLLMLLVFVTSIFILDIKVLAKVDKDTYNVKKGEKFTVLVDLDSKKNEAYDYSGFLKYDNNILQLLDKDSFKNTDGGANGLDKVEYDNKLNAFTLVTNKASVTKDVIEISFKVKKDVPLNKTKILVKNITYNDGTNEGKLADKEITINIKDASTLNSRQVATMVLGILTVLLALALIIYNVQVESKDKKKINAILGTTVITLLAIVIALLLTNKDYKEKKQNYLLKVQNIEVDYKKDEEDNNKDTNIEKDSSNDGNIIKTNAENNDANKSKDKVVVEEKKSLNITSLRASNYYPKKNELIELYFTIETNINEDVESLIINNEEYPVSLMGDGKYKVNYQVKNAAGLEEIHVTSVKFTNEKQTINYTTKVDVLKEKPTISDFAVALDSKLDVSFVVASNDSLIKGLLLITDANDKTIFSKEIVNGKNNYSLAIKENGIYKIKLIVDYDLDTNELNYFTGEVNNNSETFIDREEEIIVDYGFTFDEAKVREVSSDGSSLTLEFSSSNVLDYEVKQVLIDGEIYDVTKEGNKYLVKVALLGPTNKTLHIEKVILENAKEFSDNFATFEIFKNAPQIADLKAKTDSSKKNVSVTYKLTDTAKVLQKQYAVVKNSDNEVVAFKELPNNSKEVTFEDITEAGKYTVEILGDFDLVDGKTHTKELLSSTEFTIELSVKVTKVSLNNKYPTKNEEIVLYYTVEANTKDVVTNFEINGNNYQTLAPSGNVYMVTYKVKDKAGVEDIKLTRVTINGQKIAASMKTTVDVLKDAPTIDSYTFDDDGKTPTLSFKINDEDKAFIKGKIIISDNEGHTQEIEATPNKEVYEIKNLAENVLYNFVVEATYDLDSDLENKDNKVTSNLLNGVIEVVHDYNFTYSNLKIVNVNKNENKVTLEFESTNTTIFDIERVIINDKEYNVIKNGNTYTVEVILENSEETQLTLSNVILGNGHSFNIEKDNTMTVFKNAPTISDFEVKNSTKETLKATFKINDKSKTITNLYVQLRDNLGNILQTLTLENKATEVIFSDLDVGTYQVVILADYDLVDGNTYQMNILDKVEGHVKIDLEELSVSSSDRYSNHRNVLDKDKEAAKKVTLTYKIIANTKEEVEKIVINKKEYEATKIDANTYQVTYTVKEEAGLEKITAQKIIYANETIEVGEETKNIKPTTEVYVLKQKPFINNFLSIPNFDNRTMTITFDFYDPDNALLKDKNGQINAYAYFAGFKDKDGNTKPKISVGHNEIKYYKVKEKQYFIFRPSATYDLDSEEGNDNYYTDKSLGGWGAILIPPISINVHNIVTKNGETTTKYFDKNQEITVEFEASSVYPDGTAAIFSPQKAIIDGKEYDLTRQGNFYTAVIDGVKEAGEKEITIDAVILNNKEEIKLQTNNKVTVDILKDEVTLTDFKYLEGKETDNDIEVKASFTINDPDTALTKGKVEVTDEDGNKVQVTPNKIAKGTNNVTFTTKSNKNYTFKVFATYDRDSLDGEDNIITDKELLSQDIKILSTQDYNFTIDNLEVTFVNLEDKFVTLRFTSSNSSIYDLKTVTIDEKEYNVIKEGDYYSVDVDIEDTKRLVLNLTKAKLENNKEFKQEKSVTIFKNKPIIDNLKVTNDVTSEFKVTFDVTDKDTTLTNLYALVKDASGNVKQEIKLDRNAREVTFSNLLANDYTIEIRADYDLIDGKTHTKELLSSKKATIRPIVEISTNKISNLYPQKNEKIDLTYKILSNTEQYVKSVVINNVSYDAENIAEGIYKINYTAPNEAGVVSLELTAVNFETVTADISTKPYIEKIDVLKTVPTIENFTSTDIFEKDGVEINTVNFTFDVVDVDSATSVGTACVGDVCKEVNTGTNNVSFKVEPNVANTLSINVPYDLDMNQLPGSENINNATLTFVQSFRLLKDYKLEIANLKTFNSSEETRYFSKNEAILLSFNSRNETALAPIRIKINDKNDKSSNGEWYDVTSEIGNNGITTYYATISGKSKVGLHALEIEAITLESGKQITSNEFATKLSPIEIDVLKDAPIYEDVAISNEEAVVTVAFNVTDNDNALVDSYAFVVDSKNKEIKRQKIVSGKNSFTVQLTPGEKYNLTIERNYNLDSIDNDNLYETDEIFLTQPLEIAKKAESNFIARHLNVPKRVPDGNKVLLTFENEVLTYEDVTKVRIDGVDYDVEKEGNTYKVELTPKQKGYNTILVESVLMGGKSYKVNRNLTYVYENVVPKASFASDINEDLANNLGIIEYKLADPDKAITKLTAYMKNSAGALVTTQEIALDSTDIKMLLLRTYRYTIELKAEYDIGDGKTFETISLFTKEKVSDPRVNIIEEYTDNEIVNKGEDVVLNYKINTNIDQELRRIFIGDFSYAAKKLDNDIYQITLKATTGAGLVKYKVTRMQFGNSNYEVDDKTPISVTIRKSVPTLTHFIVDEATDSLSFKINDPDQAITKDSTLTISDGANVITKKLDKTKSNYKFKISDLGLKLNKNYSVKVNATYNLLGNSKAKNTDENADIFTEDIKLIGNVDYKFDFALNYDYYLMSVKEVLQIGFKSSNALGLKVKKVIIDGEEYDVTHKTDNKYEIDYQAKSIDAESLTVETAILENDKAFDVNKTVMLVIQPEDASISITDIAENIATQKVKFKFKINDDDGQIRSDLKFVLSDFENHPLETQYVKKDEETVEFNIPNPPTAKYILRVFADKMIITGFIKEEQLFATAEFDSIINTSIRDSQLSTYYPKQNEIITIDYAISSSKVVFVDAEDHSNQENAVNITTVVINGKEYPVELQDNGRYRVYYTAQNKAGVEEIKITQINVSNDTSEMFTRTDKIDVLKREPTIENFKTTNDLKNDKVKFTFEVKDPDHVLGNDALYAEVASQKQKVAVGKNTLEFKVTKDKLLNFSIKAEYDLDSNLLNNLTTDQNVYKDHPIFERPFILTSDYNVSFSDIKTFNSNAVETKYFEKDEAINVSFKAQVNHSLYITSIKIDGKEYAVEKDANETYNLVIKGYNKAGVVNAKIEAVTLNSGNVVTISKNNIDVEILKDIVQVKDFSYKEVASNADQLELDINVSDPDISRKQVKIEIKDEYGNDVNIVGNTNLTLGENKVIFTKTNAYKYFVAVYATYDRDTNKFDSTSNTGEDRIYYKIITTVNRYIEMKDIVDVQLFNYGNNGSVQRIDSISLDDLDVISNSLVKVTMKDLPTFYSEITDYKVENGKLLLTLSYDDAMVYTDNELKPLVVELDILKDASYSYKGSFKSLVEQMKANPEGTFVLNKDYDLDDYDTSSNTLVDFEFKGVLDGNGHTISNLHKPLFKTLRKAQVKNLVFKSASFGATSVSDKAVVALDAYGSKIINVHIDNISIYGGNNIASFVLRANEQTLIDSCSAVNINMYTTYTSQNISGVVAHLNASTVSNCYVQGNISSAWKYASGIASQASNNATITNNIVNMTITPYFGHTEYEGNGGIISRGSAILKNNVSLLSTTNKIFTIYNEKSSTLEATSENNYQLADSKSIKNTHKATIDIKKDDINTALFKKLNFDSSIWNIENVTSSNLPTLKGITSSFNDNGSKPVNSNVYIPDFNRLSKLAAYQKDREFIYHNMYKLMPFFDAKDLLTDGNKIDINSNLNKKPIKYVLPYNKNGKLVSILTTEDYDSIAKISIVYDDGTQEIHNVDFDDYYGNVASYVVSDLNVGYNYNKFVVDKNASIIKKLYDEVASYDYTKDLDSLTPDEDSRLYKEFYTKYTKNNLLDFIEKSLVNSGYMPTFDSDILDNLIAESLVDTKKLKEMLYAYNYFKYWYNIDFNEINMADTIMFHANEMFDIRMTMENISKELVNSGAKTNVTGSFYNNNLAKYTRLSNLGYFFDYYTKLAGYESSDKWFKEYFKGGLYEEVDIGYADTYYTYFDHIRNNSNVQNTFLPALTVPENSMYIISMPTQVMYGSLRIYVKDPYNREAKDMQEFLANIETLKRQAKNFYTFARKYVGYEHMNPYHDIEYDIRSTYDENGIVVYNNPNQTTENYHKYFAEAVNKWPASNGTGAYANGFEVYWNVIKLIGSFHVATHETLHNQDSKVFLQGYGRRGDSEDYTAGNLQQYYNPGWISPNIMENFESTKDMTQNFTIDRIDTDAELKDFYKKLIETNDFLDYIEAQAFLELTPEQQAKLCVQVYYPNLEGQSEAIKKAGDSTVGYRLVSADDIRNMHLTNMESLWDNQIMLRPGVKDTLVIGPGASTDSLYNIRWYQPHADNSRPDGPNFKWLAWEMAGIGGYYDGYMAYYSQSYIGKHTNRPELKTTDLEALRYITKNSTITFREYKLNNYKNVAKMWSNDDYVDADKIKAEFKTALINDTNDKKRNLSSSSAVKKKYYQALKRETNDFRISIFNKKTTNVLNDNSPKVEITPAIAEEKVENTQSENTQPKESTDNKNNQSKENIPNQEVIVEKKEEDSSNS